jgi:hypothetical protein
MYFLCEARNGKYKDLLNIASLFSSEVEIKDLWEIQEGAKL